MTTLNNFFAEQPLALCPEYGASFLSLEMAQLDTQKEHVLAASDLTCSAEFQVSAGERYAVSRGLAVVPVRGVLTTNSAMLERYLGWTTYRGLMETFEELKANEDVRGVVMDYDSPGGAVLALDAAADAIASVGKPVHGLINPLCASAAYWLASQCTDLTMSAGAEVGSIGIMTGSIDPVQPGSSGYQTTILRSSHARAKVADASTPEGRANLQTRADLYETAFHAAIARGRGIDPGDLPDLLSITDDARDGGSMFTAQEAIERGLVDVIGADRGAFYARMMELYAPSAPAKRGRSARAHAASAMAQASL